MKDKELLEKITEILKDMNLVKGKKGYRYIVEAVVLSYKNEKYLYHKSTLLYPKLAEIYGETSTGVEKAIRDSIQNAWKEVDKKAIKKKYGKLGEKRLKGPSNSEFLCAVVGFLKLEDN